MALSMTQQPSRWEPYCEHRDIFVNLSGISFLKLYLGGRCMSWNIVLQPVLTLGTVCYFRTLCAMC